MAKEGTILRTRVYVDGYNLYYGRLKRTCFKWLDLGALIESILPTILFERGGVPATFRLEPLAIKYFTASIHRNFARADDSVSSQQSYHAALSNHLGNRLQLIEGYYAANRTRAHRYEKGKTARDCEKIEIWKLEEKQSDVALAVHLVADALQGQIDHAIVVTNDTDVVPALEFARRCTPLVIGLIVPSRHNERRVNADLEQLAHWTRSHILDDELESAQLPAMVKSTSRAIHKPISWYPRPDILQPIFEEAKRVKKSSGAAWKWLHQPCAHLGGAVPISMTEQEDSAARLRDYMETYAKDFGV